METQIKTKIYVAPVQVAKPNGEAAAAILGVGIGSLCYGVVVTLATALPAFSAALGTLNPGVGPLAGKTLIGVVLWLVAWAGLHFMWKDKDVNFDKVFAIAVICILAGFLGTFPIFYDLFIPK